MHIVYKVNPIIMLALLSLYLPPIYSQDCKVDSIDISGEVPRATIDNRLYSTGDYACGGKIIEISHGEVTMRFKDELSYYSVGDRITHYYDCPSGFIETHQYILYLPDSLNSNKRYPAVIGFSPDANAKGIIDLWKDIADKYQLIVIASKEFRNDIDPHDSFVTMEEFIRQSDGIYPVDKTKVIACGLSGGGMAAHMISATYPDLIWAVITNCGRIHPNSFGEYKQYYPRDKMAVFLASPTDFNYGHMINDKVFLEELGWKTKSIEFEGGHVMAPSLVYEEAVKWLFSQERNQ